MGQGKNFAALLAEAGGKEWEEKKEEKPAPKAEPLREADALSLSVQGKKALRPGAKGASAAMEERAAQNSDWQGNKTRISAAARNLAAGVEETVAWETRLERKKKREHPES